MCCCFGTSDEKRSSQAKVFIVFLGSALAGQVFCWTLSEWPVSCSSSVQRLRSVASWTLAGSWRASSNDHQTALRLFPARLKMRSRWDSGIRVLTVDGVLRDCLCVLTVCCFVRLWNGVVPDRCRQLYKRGEEWQCFFGHKLYSTLTCELSSWWY